MTRIARLPYRRDSASYFAPFADRPWSVFLDGGGRDPSRSRYDIIAADPWATLVTRGTTTALSAGQTSSLHADDPFDLVRRLLGEPASCHEYLPFMGGAIGYFSYDLGRRLERLPQIAEDDDGLPEMAVGLYGWAVVVDHAVQGAWLVAARTHAPGEAHWRELLSMLSSPAVERQRPGFAMHTPVRSSFTREAYAAAFSRVMRYIHDGDCYQVNLAQRFEVSTEGDPWSAYLLLREAHPAPHAAYLNLPFAQVLSISPERFLQVRDARVVTQPIKGTRPRAPDPQIDAALARELRESAKDRAENVMIVDLLRNDMAKNCRIGSVRVPNLFEVQSFPSVHHLVSTVTGELAPGRSSLDLLRGCFPGGSITGAPKIRAMEIIESLEPHRRGVYCGAIGYVGYDGAMDTSIAIRTMVVRNRRATFWAGGGLVADSRPSDEYQETLDKAAPFLVLAERCSAAGATRL